MVQSMATPFNSAIALSTLFSIGLALPDSDSAFTSPRLSNRMEMPDSPPPPPPPSGPPPPSTGAKVWNFATNGLPVSYRVAIIIDAFVLLVTITSLCLLGWYMRKQYRRRRLLQAIREQEFEESAVGVKLRDMETEMEEGNFGAGGRGKGSLRGKDAKGKKKGHVRWGSNVQGGSVDLDSSFQASAHTPSPSPSPSPSATPTTPTPHSTGSESSKHETLRKFDLEFNGEEGYGDSTKLGYRVNPLGKAKNSPVFAEFRGDPLGKAKGSRLWEEEKERHRRVGQRIAAGYD